VDSITEDKKMKKMSKKEFLKKCMELENLGLTPVEFEPEARRAVYVKPGVKVVIG
jgi:hypothetical protein